MILNFYFYILSHFKRSKSGVLLGKLEKIFDYVYDTSVDEETGESTESKCDVVLVELAKPGLAEQTAKNTSDIEYIAIMSDIEL